MSAAQRPAAAHGAGQRQPAAGDRATVGQPSGSVDDDDALFRRGRIAPAEYDAHVRRALDERPPARAIEVGDAGSLARALARAEWEKASLSALLLPHDLERVLEVV